MLFSSLAGRCLAIRKHIAGQRLQRRIYLRPCLRPISLISNKLLETEQSTNRLVFSVLKIDLSHFKKLRIYHNPNKTTFFTGKRLLVLYRYEVITFFRSYYHAYCIKREESFDTSPPKDATLLLAYKPRPVYQPRAHPQG
jgi:hypothetical protein